LSSRRSRRGLTKRPHPWPPKETRPSVLWEQAKQAHKRACDDLFSGHKWAAAPQLRYIKLAREVAGR